MYIAICICGSLTLIEWTMLPLLVILLKTDKRHFVVLASLNLLNQILLISNLVACSTRISRQHTQTKYIMVIFMAHCTTGLKGTYSSILIHRTKKT